MILCGFANDRDRTAMDPLVLHAQLVALDHPKTLSLLSPENAPWQTSK